MDKRERALQAHRDWKGKIEVISRAKVTNRDELTVAYTPGVAEPCLEIQKDESLAYEYTRKGNLVAVITNGTAVLG
ncbi:MAG: NAD-dependent malic enzyme, partial [Oscillospiraceae bacterium]|nr:NAD-dependent malic enzyme [Oscillospiraceae bacterium]